MADAKFSMPDGSYPINTCADVSDAAKLAHHSKTYSFGEVEAHVMKAKAALHCPDSILPDTWNAPAQASRPPRDNLIRGSRPGIELRADDGSAMPTMLGHFAVFNQWSRIESRFEGTFMERFAPGSLVKTFKENRNAMRVTLNHGADPMAGDKPLGPITELREDGVGGYFEVPLIDTSYNHDIIPGLQAGLYGMSMRFGVMKEDFTRRVSGSEHNPDGLPERTVKEARIDEFGPVTFPAYEGADVSVRSLTDDYLIRQLLGDPDALYELLTQRRTALPGAESATHSEAGSRATVSVSVPVQRRFHSQEDYLKWLTSKI